MRQVEICGRFVLAVWTRSARHDAPIFQRPDDDELLKASRFVEGASVADRLAR